MASRTNKIWIAKKKKQQEKLKRLKKAITKVSYKNLSTKEKQEKWLIKEMINPKWNKFYRDFSWRKIICVYTWLREDTDWYRVVWKPNSSEHDFVFVWIRPALRRKINKMKK